MLSSAMPPKMSGAPHKVGTITGGRGMHAAPPPPPAPDTPNTAAAKAAAAAEAAAERRRTYQEWLVANDAPPEDDGIVVTDEGVFRTGTYTRDLSDGPDPPHGEFSTVNHWLTDKYALPDLATVAARKSVRVRCENGVIVPSVGWDKRGDFHPVRHFDAGSAYERYRRGLPPGYTGYIPHDANPVVGGKIGVIEKAHPILYSKVRPATGAVVADILDDKILTSSGVGDFYVKEKPIRGPVD